MIDILMATYNGELYVAEQINSLLEQTYTNWKLLIRDDGSKDKTLGIIEEYIKKYPNKIELIKDEKGGLRAKDNFIELLNYSKSEYVMFCDQDDVWLPNKIEITLKKMKEIECGPTLVHTDLKVVDSKLNIISESMRKYQKIDPNAKEYNSIILQNNIVGCTMMMNKSLIEISKGSYPNGIMHDWIIGIIASIMGKIEHIDDATVLYRQHGKNHSGANKYKLNIISKIKKLSKLKEKREELYKTNYQLSDILLEIKIEDNKLNKKLLEYVELPKKGLIYRKMWILRNKFYMPGILGKAKVLLLC